MYNFQHYDFNDMDPRVLCYLHQNQDEVTFISHDDGYDCHDVYQPDPWSPEAALHDYKLIILHTYGFCNDDAIMRAYKDDLVTEWVRDSLLARYYEESAYYDEKIFGIKPKAPVTDVEDLDESDKSNTSSVPVEETVDSSASEFVSTGYFVSGSKAYSCKGEIPLGQFATYVPLLLGGGRGKNRRKKNRNQAQKEINGRRPKDKVYIDQLGARNPTTMTNFKQKVLDEWRYEFNIAADGSGSFSYYFSLRDPLRAVNGSGTYERADKFAKLYDEFKVISTTLTLNFVTLNVQQGVITLAADYDTIASGTYSPTDLRDNQYMRKASPPNMLSYVVKEFPLVEGTYRGTPAVIHQRGWYDFNSPPEEGSGFICGESFPAGSAVARCILTQRVRMRHRRTIENAREERLNSSSARLDKRRST